MGMKPVKAHSMPAIERRSPPPRRVHRLLTDQTLSVRGAVTPCDSPSLGHSFGIHAPGVSHTRRPGNEVDPQTLTIKGVSTGRLADGARIRLTRVLRVTGNKTYQTAIGGTKTVLVLKPVDVPAM